MIRLTKEIYIASPYSHPSKLIMYERCHQITCIGARLTKIYGYAFILPILTSVQLQQVEDFDHTFNQWRTIDLTFIMRVDEVWVVMLPGWEESIGVTAEIDFAIKNNIPVKFLDPKTLKFKQETSL